MFEGCVHCELIGELGFGGEVVVFGINGGVKFYGGLDGAVGLGGGWIITWLFCGLGCINFFDCFFVLGCK